MGAPELEEVTALFPAAHGAGAPAAAPEWRFMCGDPAYRSGVGPAGSCFRTVVISDDEARGMTLIAAQALSQAFPA